MTRGWQAELPGTRDADEWVTGPESCDRSGMYQYTHIIRAADDPERLPRPSERRDGDGDEVRVRNGDKRPHLTFNRMGADALAAAIAAHMVDGRPRTFNRIGVELWDKTADVMFTSAANDALWMLVDRGELEHTMSAPVLFRRRKET